MKILLRVDISEQAPLLLKRFFGAAGACSIA